MSAAFQFVAEGHKYLLEGKEQLHVTGILRDVGMVCYDGIPDAVLDHKADVGTAAHAACHYADQGDLNWSTVDPKVEPYVLAWQRFRQETDFAPRLIEQRGIAECGGMKYGYTLDREGLFCGRDTLIEIKCTAGVEVSWGPQLAAYDIPLRAQDGKFRARAVVHLHPDGKYDLIRYSSAQDYQIFQCALAIETWKRLKGKVNGYGDRNRIPR